jgi:heat shock protein 4
MVGFDQSRSMGEVAASTASSNYKNTIYNFKRLVGLAFDDPRAQAEMKKVPFKCVPYKHASGGPDSVAVKVNFNGEETIISMEAVAGMMLKHLGSIAAAKAQQGSSGATLDELFPQDWVIAIPSYYNDAQRRAMLVACETTGISGVQRLMHEHTAVALSYGIFKDLRKEFSKDVPTNVMFIDMGATCYTVSIVAFETGKLVVKTCFFDENLGGRDIDEVIANWIADKFEEKYKGKLSGKPMDTPKVRIKLLAAAEKAKKTLSPTGVKEARISLECLMDDYDFNITLKAAEYEVMSAPLLARLAKPIERALEEAKLAAADLASVEIVGGSSRIGSVKETLLKVLGIPALSTTMNADEAVARGAALQSAILSPRFKVLPYEIQESQPYPIKLAWDEVAGDEQAEGMPTNSVVMFDRGLHFPIVRRVTLKRSGAFEVKCSYDPAATEYGVPEDVSKDICTFKVVAPIGDLKKIRVNVKQDIHGIINLSSGQMVEEIEDEEELPDAEAKEGEEKEKKKKIKKTLLDFTTSRPLDWTKAEIEKAFENEVAMANADRVVRETSDMRNELESYIYSMRDKISSESALAPYATEDEKATLSAALENTENWLYEDGFDATKSVYSEKLGGLKMTGGPIEQREAETSQRPGAISTVQRKVEMYTQWLNASQGNEEYAHITDEEKQTCRSKCDEISSWVYDVLDKQGTLAITVNPIVTVAEIVAKGKELTDICSPIRHKPAPKPKKEEKKEEEKAPEEKAPETPTETPPEAPEVKGEGEPMEAEATEEKPAEDKAQEPMEMD